MNQRTENVLDPKKRERWGSTTPVMSEIVLKKAALSGIRQSLVPVFGLFSILCNEVKIVF